MDEASSRTIDGLPVITPVVVDFSSLKLVERPGSCGIGEALFLNPKLSASTTSSWHVISAMKKPASLSISKRHVNDALGIPLLLLQRQ